MEHSFITFRGARQGIRVITAIILCLLLSGVSSIHAQDYTPFPDSNAVWKAAEYPYPPGPMIWYAYHWDYIILGDTLINDIVYMKIGRIDYNVQCSELFTGPYYYAAIREDTVARKVYQRGSDEDHLLYDFSLGLGDTVNTIISQGYIVGNIDSILVGDAYRRRFIYTKETWVDIEIIEGIGAYTGLLEPAEVFEHIHWLRCYYEDSIVLYVNPMVGQCDLEIDTCLPVNIGEHDQLFTLAVFPNPFTTSVTIEFTLEGNSEIQLSIYNTMGEVVYDSKERMIAPGTHKVTWSPGHHPGGLYYAVLRSEEVVSVVKMIKQ